MKKAIATAPGKAVKYIDLTSAELTARQSEEAAELAAIPDRQWQEIRNKRNQLLIESDWTQLSDAPLTTEQKLTWDSYRLELRNIPQDFNDYKAVTFPLRPA